MNLSTELYKAKKILKDVIGSQSNRRRAPSKAKRINHKITSSMKDCFVNPDIFSPTSDSNRDSCEAGRDLRRRDSKKVMTEKKRMCQTQDDDVVIEFPIDADDAPNSLNQHGILILDEDKTGKSTRDSQPQEQSTFLDKIMKESTIELESYRKRQSTSSKQNESLSQRQIM